jgi:hypothetical protein
MGTPVSGQWHKVVIAPGESFPDFGSPEAAVRTAVGMNMHPTASVWERAENLFLDREIGLPFGVSGFYLSPPGAEIVFAPVLAGYRLIECERPPRDEISVSSRHAPRSRVAFRQDVRPACP